MNKAKRRIIALASAVFLSVMQACAPIKYQTTESTAFADRIPFSLSVIGEGTDQMLRTAERLNASVNPYWEDSYVARFNAASANVPVEVDWYTYDLVRLSKQMCEETEGAFDFTLSAVSRLWSADAQSLDAIEGGGNIPALPDAASLTPNAGKARCVELDEQGGKYYLTKTQDGVTIDLGGIAKGYLADLCAEIAAQSKAKSALINVGGTLYLHGFRHQDDGKKTDWKIGVTHCFDEPYPYLCGLTVSPDTAVVTSGTYERFYESEGVRICHLVNPFTGMPVGVTQQNGQYVNETDYVVSVTVTGASGAECDAIATAVCVLGLTQGARLVQDRGLSALIVTADRRYTAVGNLIFMEGEFPLGGMQRL